MKSLITFVTWVYVWVWLGCGGVLLYYWMTPEAGAALAAAVADQPKALVEPSKTLDAAATSWLGLAVAAAYAYFGLKKP